MEQGFHEEVPVPGFQRPALVLLNSANRGLVCVLDDEVGERHPFDAGSPLDALLLGQKEAGLRPVGAECCRHEESSNLCTVNCRTVISNAPTGHPMVGAMLPVDQ